MIFNCVQDAPQATCICMEQTLACGNDNKTYTTPCVLHEEAMRRKGTSSLKLQHLGPCQSRPWILSPLEDVLLAFGQRLALNCEAEGFPIPDIFWEFHTADGREILKLPGTFVTCIQHGSLNLHITRLPVASCMHFLVNSYYKLRESKIRDSDITIVFNAD